MSLAPSEAQLAKEASKKVQFTDENLEKTNETLSMLRDFCTMRDTATRDQFLNENLDKECAKRREALIESRKKLATETLNFLGKVQKEAVQAVGGAPKGEEWELLETIMDSGANVSVSPPGVGVKAGYEVLESAASRAGVSYVAANGGEIPNLGERFLAVVTEEGTV